MYQKIPKTTGKGYKERLLCRMCKVRFTLDKEKWKKNYWPKSYCSDCCKKYMNKRKKD